MAFAGNCGFDLRLPQLFDPSSFFFCEELGVVLEVKETNLEQVKAMLKEKNIQSILLGKTRKEKVISIKAGNCHLLNEGMPIWRDIWNATSTQLELLQANPDCVHQESSALRYREGMTFAFMQHSGGPSSMRQAMGPRVAIIREEGSNGDREMAAAFFASGCSPWDVTMSDLLDKKITLDSFSGVVFVGGFSYADVMDSGKGEYQLIVLKND